MLEDETGVLKEKKEEILDAYSNFYQKLLTTPTAITEAEKEAEEIVNITMKGIEAISQCQIVPTIQNEALNSIINKLNKKKQRIDPTARMNI